LLSWVEADHESRRLFESKDEKSVMEPTILVVDDDKKTVDLIRLYLEKDGYRVLVAYDGRGASTSPVTGVQVWLFWT
jgi:PleD family two-component response regulator